MFGLGSIVVYGIKYNVIYSFNFGPSAVQMVAISKNSVLLKRTIFIFELKKDLIKT